MFEGFSFPSHPASPIPTNENESESNISSNSDFISLPPCDSARISPLSSRCPSPMPAPMNSRDFPRLNRRRKSQFQQYQLPNLGPAPTSIPPAYSDPNDIRVLTRRLDAQSLEQDIGSDSDDGFGCPITPPRSSYADNHNNHNHNNGDSGGLDVDLDRYNDSYNSFPPHDSSSHFPGTMDLDHNHNAETDRFDMRCQREKLSLLQCASSTVSDTLRLALLLDSEIDQRDQLYPFDGSCAEDQHPSSLPPSRGPPRSSVKRISPSSTKVSKKGSGSSSNSNISMMSTTTIGGNKVDKSYNYSAGAGSGGSGGTGRYNRSRCELRRKSLVIAAVTAVLEQDTARQT